MVDLKKNKKKRLILNVFIDNLISTKAESTTS